MKSIKTIFSLLLIMLCPARLHAQDSHWSINIYNYEYDMTVYAYLNFQNTVVTDYSDYEFAAFVGDECRSVGVTRTATDSKTGTVYNWVEFRIRSNVKYGERIKFKLYVKSEDKEYDLTPNIKQTFVEGSYSCLPSSPLRLMYADIMMGDVNGDKQIDITDITAFISYLKGDNPSPFNTSLADVDGDGSLTVKDIAKLSKLIFEK